MRADGRRHGRGPNERCTYWVCRLETAGGSVDVPSQEGVERAFPGDTLNR